MANLWDVTDRDLDRFSKSMFSLWGLDANQGGDEIEDIEQVRSHILGTTNAKVKRDNRGDGSNSAMDIDQEPKATTTKMLGLSLVEAVKGARDTCRLKYLVGAASVVYGIPCFLKAE